MILLKSITLNYSIQLHMNFLNHKLLLVLLSLSLVSCSDNSSDAQYLESSDSDDVNITQNLSPNTSDTVPETNPLLPYDIINHKGESVSSSVLSGKILGIYFSAQWCPPCRSFTPNLVEFRDRNSKDFEVVFVSADRSPSDQLKYMEKYDMKWYAIPHGSPAVIELNKKFEVRGIPSLVIVDPKGNTITKNGRGDVSGNPSGALASWKKKS